MSQEVLIPEGQKARTDAASIDRMTVTHRLKGVRTAMVVFSQYPADPRPRRAVEALLKEGMAIDLICEADEKTPRHESRELLDITRIPIRHFRGGAISYAYQYSTFILYSAFLLAWRATHRRYDLVYVHNMPDVLVFCALVPKLFGAKVILDQHDPMPELMRTIFDREEKSLAVRTLCLLEKWSIAFADLVITVNVACQRIFSERSCSEKKIGVVMNTPDEAIFTGRAASSYSPRRPTDPLVLMYHGSLVERNGLGLAVESLQFVRRAVPNVVLRVYGRRTPYLDEVMERVKTLDLEKHVEYLGPRSLEGLVPEIEKCDVGIIPNPLNTFTEINTPTRMFEYLAQGKPVIAPATRGIEDYFAADTLLYFQPGDAHDLAKQIEIVAFHPEEAAAVAARGQTVCQAHSWKQEKETLIQLVLSVLHSGRAPRDEVVA